MNGVFFTTKVIIEDSQSFFTRLGLLFAPSASEIDSKIMDLPAPVSPVNTISPSLKSISKLSIKTTLFMERDNIIYNPN